MGFKVCGSRLVALRQVEEDMAVWDMGQYTSGRWQESLGNSLSLVSLLWSGLGYRVNPYIILSRNRALCQTRRDS